MKIAIPSSAPDLSGRVEQKLGAANYLLVIETDDMTFEAMAGPSQSSDAGAGIQALSLVLNMGAEVVLADHIAPHIAGVLETEGITVINRTQGQVTDVVEAYMRAQQPDAETQNRGGEKEQAIFQITWMEALNRGRRQFLSLLPMLLGVIFLLGLFQAFISQEALLAFFSKFLLQDILLGAFLGSVLAGNPVNSYVIGSTILESGVGLAAVTALMMSWVNVGIIQLPAEAASLGWRFTLVRNLAGFAAAVITALLLNFLMGALL